MAGVVDWWKGTTILSQEGRPGHCRIRRCPDNRLVLVFAGKTPDEWLRMEAARRRVDKNRSTAAASDTSGAGIAVPTITYKIVESSVVVQDALGKSCCRLIATTTRYSSELVEGDTGRTRRGNSGGPHDHLRVHTGRK